MTQERARLTLLLIGLGAGWGLTQPLSKITVMAGYPPLGIVFWQLLVGALVLGVVRGRQVRHITFTRHHLLVWGGVALFGTLIPNTVSYHAAFGLPSGVMSIVMASLPMFAFPVALLLGVDRFAWPRLAGLTLGIVGVALIALPQTSLPDRAMVLILPLALVAPLCYAFEANGVAKWGIGTLDPVQVLFGSSALGAVLAGALALATGQFFVPAPPFILADATLLVAALIHVCVYTAYVWLVGRAGATFAGQVAYLVTGFGVVWAMIILGERYSLWIWAALVLMILGLGLVSPRPALAKNVPTGDDTETQRQRPVT